MKVMIPPETNETKTWRSDDLSSEGTGKLRDRVKNCRPGRLLMNGKELLRIRTTSSMWDQSFDPFQVFEVEHDACLVFQITIHRGMSITKGSNLADFMDTPDPYVVLKVPGSSNPSRRTSSIDNTTNPIWETTFQFFLYPYQEHILKVVLMDANYTIDETLGEDEFCINTLTNDTPTKHEFVFPGGSRILVTMLLTKNKTPDLRFSLALCKEEKDCLRLRRKKVLNAMQTVLGVDAPDSEQQVPIMGILGSGGGFRAMTCMSGAVKALAASGLLNCATYIAGLSGSSWYISTLYSQDSFPNNITHEEMHKILEESVTTNWKRKLTNSLSYLTEMMYKYRRGQPVSFTDFFGHLLGDILLKGAKHKRLSDQRRIVSQGTVPFPLYTCLHAKRSVSCRAFSEWVEFSPYEIGIAKYGTFMKTEHFGSKFIVGKLIRQYDEFPLHFLQGVWGSAFTILFKRLVLDCNKKDPAQVMREGMQEEREIQEKFETQGMEESGSSDTDGEDDVVGDCDRSSEDEEYKHIKLKLRSSNLGSTHIREEVSVDDEDLNLDRNVNSAPMSDNPLENGTEHQKSKKGFKISLPFSKTSSNSSNSGQRNVSEGRKSVFKFPSRKAASLDSQRLQPENETARKTSDPGTNHSANPASTARYSRLARQGAVRHGDKAEGRVARKIADQKRNARDKKMLTSSVIQSLMAQTNILNTRAGRAGEILNPFRGLSLRNSFPISPFTDSVVDETDGLKEDDLGSGSRYEPLDNQAKKLFIVDSGLAFNSPYPLLLRPQRAVDIYLSFDFSQRPSDAYLPFKELLIAEKWACQNKVPFPPIEQQIKQYENDGYVREVYIFKNEFDPYCPVILHFPLVNNEFKKFKSPGVHRTTREELDFADFPIFDDKHNQFASTNFVYEPIQFTRLVELMEFNTLLHVNTIKAELAEVTRKKKQMIHRNKQSFHDVVLLARRVASIRREKITQKGSLQLKVSVKSQKSLKRFFSIQKSPKDTDKTNSSDDEFCDATEDLSIST